MKAILLSFILIFALASCKKKPDPTPAQPSLAAANTTTTTPTNTAAPTNTVQPDTIRPLSYYPVYPGSHWTYLLNNSVTVTETTSPTYVLYIYPYDRNLSGYPPTPLYTSAYVPLYQGEPVFGYNRLSTNMIPEAGIYELFPFLTEQAGSTRGLYINYTFVPVDIPPAPVELNETVNYISKTLNANGDSMIITTGKAPNLGSPTFIPYNTYRTYVKNVGLTFYCKVDTVQHDTVEKKQLLNYYIAPH